METESYSKLFLLFVLLLSSAFFSGSEVALFSIEKKRLKEISSNNLMGRYIHLLLEHPRRLLVTILLGNTVINVAASIVAVTLAIEIASAHDISIDLILMLQIIILTILILIFGEITPKIYASRYPVQFAKFISIPLYWVSILIFPIAKVLSDLIRIVFSRIKPDARKTAILNSELSELADISAAKGTIVEDEQELIHGLVSFREVMAREVMTPRVDISAVSVDTSLEGVMKIITDSGHSRLPLYEDNLDNIKGIIYAKDLLKYLREKEQVQNFSLVSLARNAMFVPETKLISELMQEFQSKKLHMGIVVDEYGGTSGLISLEDILEEIVGEIVDEYDKEENPIVKLSERSYVVLGKVDIDEINELLETDLSSENDDYETIGGFIFNQAGTIPEENYNFVFDRFRFTVKKLENKRIYSVQIDIIDQPDEE